jgi:predicted amino acid racemase
VKTESELRLPITRMLERNPNLVRAAIELHQSGVVPAATYMIDLDAIADNARAFASVAKELNLRTYIMTKQDGHNPYLAKVALGQGIDKVVAVETIEANIINRFGLPLGHVGHLSNIPRSQVARVVAMRPDAITVFSLEAAQAVSRAATELGVTQKLYVRVNKHGDEVFPGMVGGWEEESCVKGIAPVLDLPNVEVAGLTMHPCISYTNQDAKSATPTNSFFTMLRAKETLERELGLSNLRVNCAGNCNSGTIRMLAGYGATDVEPGSGMTGSSLYHLYGDLPERPAQVYVSEVMHHWQGETNTLGGGLTWLFQPDVWQPRCMVGSTFEEASGRILPMRLRGVVDYHGVCGTDGPAPRIGDSAIYPLLLPQVFMNRCYVAAVSGIASGNPKLEGLFDTGCNELDGDLQPIPAAETRKRLAAVGATYAARSVN